MSPVVFAPTLAAAKKAGRSLGRFRSASPRSDGPLDEALALGSAVRFCAPANDETFWTLVRLRYWLPPVPALLRDAIGGIARHETAGKPRAGGRAGRGRGRLRALWIEGRLSDARAAALLRSSADVPLWIVQDFRKLAASDRTLRRVEKAGVRLAALRTLRASVLRSRG